MGKPLVIYRSAGSSLKRCNSIRKPVAITALPGRSIERRSPWEGHDNCQTCFKQLAQISLYSQGSWRARPVFWPLHWGANDAPFLIAQHRGWRL